MIALLLLTASRTLLANEDNNHPEYCYTGNLSFWVSKAECSILKRTNSDVITFSVRLSNKEILNPGLANNDNIIIRLLPKSGQGPRLATAVNRASIKSENENIKKYLIGKQEIMSFKGSDDQFVYARQIGSTIEGNRNYKEMEVLYQFDVADTNLKMIDEKVLELLNKITLR